MKITRKQLRQLIREVFTTVPDEEFDKITMPGYKGPQPGKSLESFRVPYKGFGYGGRRIISRDRAWLEFVPKGAEPSTQEDMFRSVTLLDQGDTEVEKVINRGGWYVDKYLKAPVDQYDVYSVHATTTG
jgi:hypothetical protein